MTKTKEAAHFRETISRIASLGSILILHIPLPKQAIASTTFKHWMCCYETIFPLV